MEDLRLVNNLIRIASILLLAGVLSSVFAQDSRNTLNQAKVLFEQGNAAEALAMLRPLQQQFAGSYQYDHLFGLALLESGEASEAEIVLERVLASNPQQHGVRLDLARALLAQDKLRAANEELDLLEAASPPPRAAAAMQEMRGVIKSRSRGLKFSKRLALHTGVGYDSNVSSSTAASSFLGFQLDSQSQEQESDFFQYGVDGSVGYRLSDRLTLRASAGLRQRNNSQASFVDSRAIRAAVGVNYINGGDMARLGLSMYELEVDGNNNSEGLRLQGAWMRKIGEVWRVGLNGEIGRVEFTENLAVKDVDRMSGGLLLDRRVGPDGQGALSFSVGLGSDDPLQDSSRYSRDFYYVSSSLNWAFSDTFRSNLLLSYRNSQYDEVFFEQLFTEVREDDLYRVSGTINWDFRDNWSLMHRLAYTHNDTFIDIFEYERFEASLQLNYVFR